MIQFFETIWPLDSDLWGELRAIREGKVIQSYHRLDMGGITALSREATDLNDAEWDTYYGVLPRTRREGTAQACVPITSVLWADIDAKHHSDDLTIGKRIALRQTVSVTPSPQVVVDSGGGYHAYWLLRDPVPFGDARVVMAGIAHVIGGDAVYDAPRVLRIPGSWNWKRKPEEYSRILRLDITRPRYSLGDFSDYTYERDVPSVQRHPGAAFERIDLPEWLTDLIRQGAPQGQRSEAVFKAVLWLLRYGRTHAEIYDVIEQSPDGLGQKYAEMPIPAAHRWLDRTITHAREVA